MGLATMGSHYYSRPEEVAGRVVLPRRVQDRSRGALQTEGHGQPGQAHSPPSPCSPVRTSRWWHHTEDLVRVLMQSTWVSLPGTELGREGQDSEGQTETSEQTASR